MEEAIGRTATTTETAGGVEKFWNHLDEQSRKRLMDAAEEARKIPATGWQKISSYTKSNPWRVGGSVLFAAVALAGLVLVLTQDE